MKELPPSATAKILQAREKQEAARRQADARYAAVIRRVQARGYSLASIGRALGFASKQGIDQLLAKLERRQRWRE